MNSSNIFDRPQIGDDAVQYNVHLPHANSSKTDAESMAALALAYVNELLPGHLWNRDSFQLKPEKSIGAQSEWILEGRMRVGDSVDDEWLVVWLLRQISAKWDVAIAVYDTDGEFLLIEAADYIPPWLNPSNADNRVWIYRSTLHIISLTYTSPSSTSRPRRRLLGVGDSDEEDITNDDNTDFIIPHDAVKIVRNPGIATEGTPAIQNAVWRRTTGYPRNARQHIHYTAAFLPIDIAKALSQEPSLIQKATEAFYTRDAIQLRAAHRMSRFPPAPCVLETVKLTRTAYAQLVGQKFHPPKIFGVWKEQEGSREWRWRDVGMKIACGFEMVYQESKVRSSFTNPVDSKSALDGIRDSMSRDPQYQKYIANLSNLGYFKGELKDSMKWQSLESSALVTFIEMNREDGAKRSSFAALVDAALDKCPLDSYHSSLREEDPEDWLNVDIGDLDRMLESDITRDAYRQQNDTKPEKIFSQEQQASKLQELAKKVENFVKDEGTIEGVKFQDEPDSDDEMELDDFSEGMPSSEDDDPDGDATALSSADRQKAMDTLIPALELSDYGKMPASFYSNSQATLPFKAFAQNESIPAVSVSDTDRREPRKPLIPRDHFDGVDSDDETDPEEEHLDLVGDIKNSDEEEEDYPQVVGEVEIDMKDEEEEFLEFSRDALGITDDLWETIVQDRKNRGAFLPSTGRSNISQPSRSPKPSFEMLSDGSSTKVHNPNLDSFEAVMHAMEAELSRLKSSQATSSSHSVASTTKGKSKAEPEEMEDIERAMDEQLQAALVADDDNSEGDDIGNADVDYNLIKNFLESFKSQGGLSGPVSNLARHLQPDWNIPRDES